MPFDGNQPHPLQLLDSATPPPSHQKPLSPGTCPALEHRGELIDAPAGAAGAAPTEAASLIVAHARSSDAAFDLDARLSKAEAAEAAAWRALAAAALEPASAFSAWCDPSAFDEFTKKEYGAGLPFPLSALIPRSTRKSVSARFFSGGEAASSSSVRERVLSDAVAAHAAIVARLSSASSSSSGPFFFGKTPSSLDALLFAHLSFHAGAPVSPPELRESVRCRPEIGRYLAAVAEAAGLGAAAAAVTAPPPYVPGSGWEAAAADAARAARAASPNDFSCGRPGAVPARGGGGVRRGGGRGKGDGSESSSSSGGSWWWPFGRKNDSGGSGGGAAAKRDLSHRRGNALWVASVTALVLGYVALSGQYFTIEWEDLDAEGGVGGDGGGGGEGGGDDVVLE